MNNKRYHTVGNKRLKKSEGAIKNEQSRETGNIGHTTHRTKTKKRKENHTTQKTKKDEQRGPNQKPVVNSSPI